MAASPVWAAAGTPQAQAIAALTKVLTQTLHDE
jgi:hypothetical protein